MSLSKDVWNYIAKHFLMKDDIAKLMSCSKCMHECLKHNIRLFVRNIGYPNEIRWTMFIEFKFDWLGEDDMDEDDILCVSISYIDRGVEDFVVFGKILKQLFPNLSELSFCQNYSYNETEIWSGKGERNWEKNFIEFVKFMKLTYLTIEEDQQSDFFYHFNWLNVLNAMPERSTYKIINSFNIYCRNNYSPTQSTYTKGTKQLIFVKE